MRAAPNGIELFNSSSQSGQSGDILSSTEKFRGWPYGYYVSSIPPFFLYPPNLRVKTTTDRLDDGFQLKLF